MTSRGTAKILRPARAIVRQPGTLADTAPRAGRPVSAIPADDRLRAGQLATAEGCSITTARKLMHSGRLGPIHGRNARDRWIDRQAYIAWLATL